MNQETSKIKKDLPVVVGHKRTPFPLWTGWRFATYQPVYPEDFPLTVEVDPRLPDALVGEYHYLFSLRRELETINEFLSIRIAQYRRIVVREALGESSSNQPWTRVITPQQAEALDTLKLTTARKEGFLISSVAKFPTVLLQYATSHHARDLLRFLSDAVDAGTIDNADATSCLLINGLIPAPSNGTFPVTVFVQIMKTLEHAAIAYLENGNIPRTEYQRRAIGFCLERLNSYLLIKELRSRNIDLASVIGQQITISDSTHIAGSS
jgi:hypothetical protein